MTSEWVPLSLDDVHALVGLRAAIEAEDKTGENYGVDDVTELLADPLVDTDEGTLGVWEDGRLVAFGVLMARPAAEPLHRMILGGGVHPGHRRRGLGRRLVDWAVRSAPALHEKRFPGRPLELLAYVDDRNEGGKALVASAGLTPVRWFCGMGRDLTAEPPRAPLPEGLRIVAYHDDLEDAVRKVRNASFSDHWGSTRHTAESWRNALIGTKAFRPEASFVAVDASGTSVAVLLTSHYEADTAATGIREAWIQIIGTLREWRGRGVASAMLAHALTEFRAQGYQRAGLSVDADSPTGALGVYTRAGFTVEDRTITHAIWLA
ncbi:N-acetyltransferase [Planomonospora parontospora subsp. parontospora]|uniref:N-acetyltransferase n=2 Tax=Planomonospora parontospora TaxID=58119 RepID=A0AA37F3V8_9ACTN|nr:GNAT family N-acetyltransferase [Planomonospora parontospora]GGK61417.1 N-acetyltransferase [Planomonospora parontospora]GII08664.1 N-acetyltransferase [Planomonospora parontospora subsp. parontospora]